MPRFSGPTVSIHNASPIVQTKADDAPWKTLAMVNTATVCPTKSMIVATISALRPAKNGSCLELVLSAIAPANGERMTDAAAYAASNAEVWD